MKLPKEFIDKRDAKFPVVKWGGKDLDSIGLAIHNAAAQTGYDQGYSDLLDKVRDTIMFYASKDSWSHSELTFDENRKPFWNLYLRIAHKDGEDVGEKRKVGGKKARALRRELGLEE